MSKRDLHQATAAVLRATSSSPDLTQILAQIEQFIRKYVVLPGSAHLPVSLWVIATHAVQQFDTFPYLAVISATKRSGKTRLAEVLETLVRQPWRGTAPSVAALYRMLESAPSLLLDEVEVFNSKNKSDTTLALLAVLNAGHRKGATVPRCDGPKHELRHFPVFGPKLFAAIARLPDTLMDRSIVIHMKRRSSSQNIERFRQAEAAAEAKPIHENAVNFVRMHQTDITQAYSQYKPKTALTFLNDRDADVWTPLFTICSAIDPERLAELKQSALALSAAKANDDVDDSYALTLLRDIKAVWPWDDSKCAPEDKCETAVLVEKLKALEESPWCDPKYLLTARRLAHMLKPFDAEPRTLRMGERVAKGYYYAELKDAFDRYLDEISVTCVTTQ